MTYVNISLKHSLKKVKIGLDMESTLS